ncbi:MAG: hypothetical protein CVU59_05325 [Deltaproteobacteria bacterium HGW-Deltaproteobacteria-17]|nr:MAG: hypothetical protein CVU59_05325 [Deltaproteobacteria bacterium HGW-Deltaproteobacteria-17]
MKPAAPFLILAAWLACVSCSGTKGPELTVRLESAQVGRTITVEGVAENRKDGAVLRGEHFELWIVELTGWPESDRTRVRATGILAEDHGRPVFIRRPDEPIVQGVEVPEGTDLEKASRRWVLKNVRWQWLP